MGAAVVQMQSHEHGLCSTPSVTASSGGTHRLGCAQLEVAAALGAALGGGRGRKCQRRAGNAALGTVERFMSWRRGCRRGSQDSEQCSGW